MRMAIKFEPIEHKYVSIDDDCIDWTSVTSIISKFKKPFDSAIFSEKFVKH